MSDIAERQITKIVDVPIKRESIVDLHNLMADGIARGELVSIIDQLPPVQHFFIPGAYARHCLLTAGSLVIGKIHRYPCFNFIMRGRATVFDEQGVKDIIAPFFFVSEPGAKRVVLSHEEVLWVTVHGTDATTPEEAEEFLIAKSYEDLGSDNVKEISL